MMSRSCSPLILALLVLASGASARADEAAGDRAWLLYQTHCTACHDSSVHTRARRKATTAAQVETWVRYWSGALHLDWSDADVRAVAALVDTRYYHF